MDGDDLGRAILLTLVGFMFMGFGLGLFAGWAFL